MVNISKRPVDEKKLFKIYQLFFKVIDQADNKEEFFQLIQDIFSPSEQIMIAKRIGVIYLLIKNVNKLAITKYLKVSMATVDKYYFLYYKKKTNLILIIESFLEDEKINHFFEDLFADIFIHPGIYIGHHQLNWEHKKRQKERLMIDV
ncbi:MAG: Trp family transcriptional regulator [Candidatus Roizmanbacteria bacterium]|nr:Trp family transcriptional regulator [Candidatus Roizmanbacteria bacterium]MCR4313389.1 Trp family transcriptional regulator [Candidatus Roizmanbacteria bacterium]